MISRNRWMIAVACVALSLGCVSVRAAWADDEPEAAPSPSPSASPTEAQGHSVYIGTIGRSGNSEAKDPEYWLKHELEDWFDPSTGSTLVASKQCGSDIKMRLLGTKRRNFVEVEVKAGEALQAEPAKVSMVFGGKPNEPRESQLVFDPGTIELEAGDSLFAAIPFPEKSDFAGETEIKVRVPLGKCTAESVFKRPAGQEIGANEVTWTGMQLGVELGGAVAKTGNLNATTDKGFQFELSVTRYPWLHHGFWVGVEFENLGKSGSSSVASGISGLGAYLGYSFRHYLSDRWVFHVDVAPGLYEFASAQTDQGLRSLDHAFVVSQRIGVDWIFGRVGEPDFLDSDHGVGLLLGGDWYPRATIGGVSAAGYSFSVQLRYLFGI